MYVYVGVLQLQELTVLHTGIIVCSTVHVLGQLVNLSIVSYLLMLSSFFC